MKINRVMDGQCTSVRPPSESKRGGKTPPPDSADTYHPYFAKGTLGSAGFSGATGAAGCEVAGGWLPG